MYKYFSFIPETDWDENSPYIQMNHQTEIYSCTHRSMPAAVYNSEGEI